MSKRTPTHPVFHVVYHPPHQDSHLLDELLECILDILNSDTKITRYAISKEKGTHLHLVYETVVPYTVQNQRYQWKNLKIQFGWKEFKPCLKVKHHARFSFALGYIVKDGPPISSCGIDEFDLADAKADYETGECDYIGEIKNNKRLSIDDIGDLLVKHMCERGYTTRFEIDEAMWIVMCNISDDIKLSVYNKLNSEKTLDYVCMRVQKHHNGKINFKQQLKSNPIYICQDSNATVEKLLGNDDSVKLDSLK